MNRAQMVAELHYVLNNATSGGLISDAVLLNYLAEGQEKLCEDTGFFVDFMNFQIETTPGVADYVLDSRIIEVWGLFDADKNVWLGRTSEALNRPRGFTDRFPFNPGVDTADSAYWQTDRETGVLTLSPTPTTARTFQLRCWRYPMVALNGTGAEPEIPARFRRACVEWAAYKVFMHHDMETQDPVKATEHFNAYRMYAKEGATHFRRMHQQEVVVSFDQAYRT